MTNIIGRLIILAFSLGIGFAVTPVGATVNERYRKLFQICEGLHNSLKCAKAIEEKQLPRFPGKIKRDGKELHISSDGGRILAVLTDTDPVPPNSRAYALIDFLPEMGSWLVHEQYWEGSAYLMVNATTGAQTQLDGLPLVSPDKRRFATVSFAGDAGYDPNRIRIYEIKSDKPNIEWSLEPPRRYAPITARWTSVRSLLIGFTDFQLALKLADMDEEKARKTCSIELSRKVWSVSKNCFNENLEGAVNDNQ